MPDPNKLAALEAIGYEIRLGCGSCKHGAFVEADGWGKCMITPYEHGKHVGRKLASVHEAGWCSRVEMRQRVERELAPSGFLRFLPTA